MRAFVAVVCALALAACGGGGNPGGPTPAPSPATGTMVYEFFDGGTGADASALVTVGGETKPLAHIVTFTNVTKGAEVSAESSGFFTRRAVVNDFSSTPKPVRLWPNGATLPEQFTKEILYEDSVSRGEVALTRPTTGVVYLTLAPELRADKHREGVRWAAGLLGNAVGWASFIEADDPPAGSVAFTIRLNSSMNDSASTSRRLGANGETTGGTIEVRVSTIVLVGSDILLHELGHTLGLRHLWSYNGLMNTSRPPEMTDFTEQEKLVMKMMQYRSPKNKWPDDARAISGGL